ncbi:hypothetical protein EIN_316040 [Entamoeba invadens IP1]|uniref:Actin n=1 Tax=Entamoeba invadens IP1 TaxID=370355 RepID=A0A0A1TZC8_ENTIV|nr:hypothetical protein EIN_316040 [Entamoeba invadens IP1]ELP86945.1 hypothetical protein EIN_316040 [Entamoeba invadens IP1]|eukprot:XP_004253716.1 hypothetical protein EIN_316040 [Entamoeba invadens IP1]
MLSSSSSSIPTPLVDAPEQEVVQRKTEELVMTPENSPLLKRSKNNFCIQRQVSGYHFEADSPVKPVVQNTLHFTRYTGAHDPLLIANGSKVVIDIGTLETKVGLLTDDSPRRRIPMSVNGNFFLTKYHLEEYVNNKEDEENFRTIFKIIYSEVLRQCKPEDHPVYFTLNTHLLKCIDTIRGVFTSLGVNVVKYVDPISYIFGDLREEERTGLVLDFGSSISLKAVVSGECVDYMEIDNHLFEVALHLLETKGIKPTTQKAALYLCDGFCSEKFNEDTITVDNEVINVDKEDVHIFEDTIFDNTAFVALFGEVLSSVGITKKRALANKICVIGGCSLEGIECRVEKELKKAAPEFHLQTRDFKVERKARTYDSWWEATKLCLQSMKV